MNGTMNGGCKKQNNFSGPKRGHAREKEDGRSPKSEDQHLETHL